MARYEHLPIYRRSFELALYIEQVVHGFSRHHKYGLGVRLQHGAQRILEAVIRAQNSAPEARIRELEGLRVDVELLDGQARDHAERLGLREIVPRPGFRRRAGFPLRHLTRFVDAARRLGLPVTVVVQQPGAFAIIRRRGLGFRVVPALPSGRAGKGNES